MNNLYIDKNKETPEIKLLARVVESYKNKELRYKALLINDNDSDKLKAEKRLASKIKPFSADDLNFLNSKLFKAFIDVLDNFDYKSLKENLTNEMVKTNEEYYKELKEIKHFYSRSFEREPVDNFYD